MHNPSIHLSNYEFTGERIVPGKVDFELLEEHISRYRFALDYSIGAKALDAACGTGYGCFILSSVAEKVIGIDISKDAIEFARNNFQTANSEFLTGDANSIPFGDNSFNLVTAFEIFEHVMNPSMLISELWRVTANDGYIIISTPNAQVLKSSKANPFHVREYKFEEFSEIIQKSIKGRIVFLGQRRCSRRKPLQKYYLLLKRKLRIGPILKKHDFEISSNAELLTMKTSSEFSEIGVASSEFFIALIKKVV